MPIQLLQELITYPTITPKECGIYQHILSAFTPILQNPNYQSLQITQEKEGVKNCFYAIYPKSANKEHLRHLCFAGHIDVVPTGEGWEVEPFSGEEKDGYIYGRGAQDMKGGISSFICAITQSLQNPDFTKQFLQSQCMLSFLLTSDEEGDGIYGTRFMLAELESQNLLPDMCIVAEPTSTNSSGDMIKIGRRGSINGTIIIQGKQGHVAYPQKCINPIELLGAKLGKLAGVALDSGNADFAKSQLVITDIRGGMEVVNVTPQNLKIMFNIRNSPLSNEDSIRSYIEQVLQGLPYELELKTSSLPFITKADSPLVTLLCHAIKHITHKSPELSTSGGTSDARFFAQYGVDVVELGVPNDRIHAINERVSIGDVLLLRDIFIDFLALFLENAKSIEYKE